MQSRCYVHGRAIRGALVNALASSLCSDEPDPYETASEVVRNIRFTYFWPAYCRETSPDGWNSLSTAFPFPVSDGLRKLYPNPIKIRKEALEYLFMHSEQRTSVGVSSRTAEEGVLFEVESISSHTREGKQVYLVGTLWISDSDGRLGNPTESFSNLLLGGERTYGWGRGLLRLEPAGSDRCDPTSLRFSGHVPAHLIPKESRPDPTAKVEALAGWETMRGKTRLTSVAAYEPGYWLDSESIVEIDESGIWRQT